MAGSRRHRTALALLLAAFAHPAWDVAHAVGHEHRAQHHGEATPPSAPHAYERGTQPHASPDRSHDHEHEHLVAVFLPPTRGSDLLPHTALPATEPTPRVAATRRGPVHGEPEPSRARPGAAGASEPRAPPIS